LVGDSVSTPTITVSSPAMARGGRVPARFTCDGADVSPPLQWHGVPGRARHLTLEVTDPDAPGGTFVHWNVTGIPTSTTAVAAGSVPAGGHPERTSFGVTAYRGPCPPRRARAHRYRFTVRAVDDGGHTVGTGRLTASYSR